MLESYTSEPLLLEVADYVRVGTRYKQKVVNRSIILRDDADGSLIVTMPLEIQAYCLAEDGGYGERMPHADRTDTLVSESTRAVDPATGAMRYRQLTSTTAFSYASGEVEDIPAGENGLGDWAGYLEAKEEALMLQGHFLKKLHDLMPVSLRSLREQYVRDADAEPSRFA